MTESQAEMDFRLGIVQEMRTKINDVDALLLATINERVRIAKQLKEFKEESGIALVDKGREHFVVRRCVRLLGQLNGERVISEDAVETFFQFVISVTKDELELTGSGNAFDETNEIPF